MDFKMLQKTVHALHGYPQIKEWLSLNFDLIPEEATKPNFEIFYVVDSDGDIIAELNASTDLSEWFILIRSKTEESIEMEIFGQDKPFNLSDVKA